MSLVVQDLSKKYGTRTVVDHLSFEMNRPGVYALLGTNGAGKTTTMKMILGFLKQDSGVIKVCGEEVKFGETKTNKFIGYLPDVPEYYGYMTPHEYLKLCGEITNMKKSDIKKKSEELLELVGLSDYKKRKISKFSRGMKQRLGIAQAIMENPDLILFDEPTNALDDTGVEIFANIISEYKQKGKSFILVSHNMDEIKLFCDKVYKIDNYTLKLQDKI